MGLLDKWYALDLGAYQMHFYDYSSQEQASIRTIMAYKQDQLLVYGQEVFPYLYKELDRVQIKYPISHGQMLNSLSPLIKGGLEQLHAYDRLFRPCILVCVPSDLTQEQREIWQREFLKCDISKVEFVENMEILQKEETCFLIHAGHSYTELAIYADDKKILEKTLFYAGAQMDEQIQKLVYMKTGCFISKVDAALLKEQTSLALAKNKDAMLSCYGFDRHQNLCSIQIKASYLWPALEMVERQISLWAKHCFDQLPMQLQEYILLHGVHISGGLANCFGLSQIISGQLSCPILCTNKGQCDMINALKEWKA